MKKKQAIVMICVLTVSMFGGIWTFPEPKSDAISNDKDSALTETHVSSYWDNFSFIHINGNWSAGVAKGWIKGARFQEYRQ